FLMKGDGQWIVPSGPRGGSDSLKEALRSRVLQSDLSEEHFIFNWREESYSVSYGTMNRLGTDWIYVSATPLQALTRPVIVISWIILGFSCFGLLLAVVLSWVVSKRLYKPVGRLV